MNIEMNKQREIDIKNAIKSTFQLVLFIGISTCFNYSKQKSFQYNISKVLSFLGGQYLMSSISSASIEHFKINIQPLIAKYINDPYKKILDYECFDLTTIEDENIRKKVQQLIELGIKNRSKYLKDKDKCDYYYLDKTINLIDFFITVSKKTKKLKPNELTNLIEKMNAIVALNTNATELKEKVLKPIIGNMVIDEKMPFSPIYLVGEPGTGKTLFVNTLAKELDIPIFKVDHKTELISNQFTSHHFDGRAFDNESVHFNISKTSTISKIVFEFKKKGYMGILFVDELDKCAIIKDRHNTSDMTLFLLRILNDDSEIHDSYLSANVDIRNVLVICTGNKNLSDIDSNLQPLEERFVTIKFPSINPDLKLKIALNYASKCLNEPLSEPLSERHIEEIKKLTNADDRPGVRLLFQNIRQYITKYKHEKLFQQ